VEWLRSAVSRATPPDELESAGVRQFGVWRRLPSPHPPAR